MRPLFVTGIGTGVGKTVVSAIIVEALHADYWKPVQSGGLDHSDTDIVRELISNHRTTFHPERYRLLEPISPHAAALREGITIKQDDFTLPITARALVIEGAGGILVPMSDTFRMIDLARALEAKVLIVSQNYLGSINHTLLTCEVLQKDNVSVAGIIFNGAPTPSTEEIIAHYSTLPILGAVRQENEVTKAMVQDYAAKLRPSLMTLLE